MHEKSLDNIRIYDKYIVMEKQALPTLGNRFALLREQALANIKQRTLVEQAAAKQIMEALHEQTVYESSEALLEKLNAK